MVSIVSCICVLRHYSVLGVDFSSSVCYVTIYSGYFCSPSSSQLLLRGAPYTVPMCRSLTPKRHRQLRVEDLPKVPTWQLKRD